MKLKIIIVCSILFVITAVVVGVKYIPEIQASDEPTVSKFVGLDGTGVLYEDYPIPETLTLEELIEKVESLEQYLYQLNLKLEILESQISELERQLSPNYFSPGQYDRIGELERRIKALEKDNSWSP